MFPEKDKVKKRSVKGAKRIYKMLNEHAVYKENTHSETATFHYQHMKFVTVII